MKVKNPRFVTSAYDYDGCPQHNWLEFAFAGRSNVGKSSLINKLLNRKKLARTSSDPGRTQSINFYNIDDRFFLVDLPGYGFARVPEQVKNEWGRLINEYLVNRPQLAAVIQIVDARHKPTADDQNMIDWLIKSGLPTMVVGTKVDKISRSKRKKQEKLIRETLRLTPDIDFAFFSAKTGEGEKRVSNYLTNFLEEE